MNSRLKLTRGLADISPLFEKEEIPQVRTRIVESNQILAIGRKFVSTPEIFFIWSEDDESDAHFLNNFFASKMVAPDVSALLMNFEEGANLFKNIGPEPWNRSLHRICLPATRVKEAFMGSKLISKGIEKKAGPQIFLQMNKETLFSCPELVRSLDHVVFFLKPQVESVTETYRKLKHLTLLGMRADVTVLFDADDAGGLPARLYELFSDFVSRRLSLSMNYLGTLHLSRGAEGLRQDICWESWNNTRASRLESIEKTHFLSWVETLNKEETVK